jgi:hypothetical protein
LGVGCHCNPGAREVALNFAQDQLTACFKDKDHQTYAEFLDKIQDSVSGVVRVSLGLASTFRDVYRFVRFASEFTNRSVPPG